MADDPAARPVSANLEARLVAAIRAWRDTHIANSPIAREVACWNHLQSKLDDLVASIMREF
jgi:hypothetical protein